MSSTNWSRADLPSDSALDAAARSDRLPGAWNNIRDTITAHLQATAPKHQVHNHGSEGGAGLACREIRLTDGRLLGLCMLPEQMRTVPGA